MQEQRIVLTTTVAVVSVSVNGWGKKTRTGVRENRR